MGVLSFIWFLLLDFFFLTFKIPTSQMQNAGHVCVAVSAGDCGARGVQARTSCHCPASQRDPKDNQVCREGLFCNLEKNCEYV